MLMLFLPLWLLQAGSYYAAGTHASATWVAMSAAVAAAVACAVAAAFAAAAAAIMVAAGCF